MTTSGNINLNGHFYFIPALLALIALGKKLSLNLFVLAFITLKHLLDGNNLKK